eukprot:6859446-Karenia_brevis.AAC.1
MDDLYHLDYLDGQLSSPGLPGWTTFTTCLDYLGGRPSPAGLLQWTTFTAWSTWMDSPYLPW